MVRELPLVVRFHDRTRAGAVQPRERRGIVAQVGVPKRRGQREDHPMMIRVARLAVARQRAVGEDRMLGIVQHQLIFRRAVERRIHRPAGFHVRVADGSKVLGAGHEQPGNLHRAKRLGRAANAWRARAERNRRFDARVGELLSAHRQSFAAHRLGRHRAEGMAGHPDLLQVQPAGERMGFVRVPGFELVQHSGNVLHAQ